MLLASDSEVLERLPAVLALGAVAACAWDVVRTIKAPCPLRLWRPLAYLQRPALALGRIGLAAITLFINNHIIYYHEWRALLVVRNAQIEAKYLSVALSGKAADETAGFVVAESSVKLMRQDDARLRVGER